MKNLFLLTVVLLLDISVKAQTETSDDPQNMIVEINQEAHFPGGETAMFQTLYQTIKWPDIKAGLVDDYLTVSFNVLTDSSITDVAVMKGIRAEIDKAVVDALKKMKFAPSVQMGTKVKMNLMMNIPVRWRFD